MSEPTTGRPFRYLSYDAMVDEMRLLAKTYPDYIRLYMASKEFGLEMPAKFTCGDGSSNNNKCEIYILHVTNFTTYSGEERSKRPQVYFSGEIHGDERVGPHACIELASLLVTQWNQNEWLRKLLNSRSVFLTPMTNPVGYSRNTRGEFEIDPNRDYPIDQDPDMCMRAFTSRAVNELFRRHMFQLAVTFHGGMEALAVEWGTLNRAAQGKHASPDDVSQMAIVKSLAKYAGSFPGTGEYPIGRMNDLVYPVRGGMEDWAYAGSWDPTALRSPCAPKTNGGYPSEKTIYSPSMLRVFNLLVETSNHKSPHPSTLGDDRSLLRPNGPGSGHVARNVRLGLEMIDLVEPYLQWCCSREWERTDFVVQDVNKVLSLSWEVGGCFEVDETELLLRFRGQTYKISSPQSGNSRWMIPNVNAEKDLDRLNFPFLPKFQTCFKLPSDIKPGETVTITAKARVDSFFVSKKQKDTADPTSFPPQTHFVNARTNANWNHENGGFQVQGRVEWFSKQLSFTFDPTAQDAGGYNLCKGGEVMIVDNTTRYDEPVFEAELKKATNYWEVLFFFGLALVASGVLYGKWKKRQKNQTTPKVMPLNQSDEEEDDLETQ